MPNDLRALRTRFLLWVGLTFLVFAGFVALMVPLGDLPGQIALQQVSDAEGMRALGAQWTSAGVAHWVQIAMGLDYLYMLGYGAAMFTGAKLARLRFVPSGGIIALVLRAIGLIGVLGALIDVVENALELWVAFANGPDIAGTVATYCTSAKWICVPIGLIGVLGGLIASIRLPKPA